MAEEEPAPRVHLLALVGLAPAVASETFWALRREGVSVSAISLVTTARGAPAARQSLMDPGGALAQIAALEIGSPSAPPSLVAPPIVRLHVLRGPARAVAAVPPEIDDIGDREAYLAMLDWLDRLVRRLTAPDAPPCTRRSPEAARPWRRR